MFLTFFILTTCFRHHSIRVESYRRQCLYTMRWKISPEESSLNFSRQKAFAANNGVLRSIDPDSFQPTPK